KLLSISCRFLPSPIPALPAARSALRLRPLRSLCSCPSIFQLRFLSPFSSISGSIADFPSVGWPLGSNGCGSSTVTDFPLSDLQARLSPECVFMAYFLFSCVSGSGVRSCRWDFSSILATTSSGNFSPPMTHNYPSIGDLNLRNHSPAGSSAFLSPSAHSKLAVVDRWLVAQADGSSTADRNSASWVVLVTHVPKFYYYFIIFIMLLLLLLLLLFIFYFCRSPRSTFIVVSFDLHYGRVG
ncbi:hypothetical protein LINPERHAP1_LOCUS8993, partial [Linum perenne]